MHHRVLGLVAALLIASLALPAQALTLLRDSDVEYGLQKLATPVFKAAGLSPSRMKILVIDDPNLNAFVIDRDHIFIHSGLIMRMTSARMLQSVIAHEAAHISNGHLARRVVNARSARTAAGIGAALAVAAAASGSGEAALGIAAGTQSAAMRRFFAHTRAEESAADNSAVRIMGRAGLDPFGAVEVLDIFRGQEALSTRRQDAYVRSHPLSSDRYRNTRALAGTAPTKPKDASSEYWFQRVKGKLSAFQRSPKWTLTRAGESGHGDIKAMRQAIAYHRGSNLKRALPAINQAIAARSGDPFYYDLKGQILFESRQFAAAAQAYQTAAKLAPSDALIQGNYGRALLALGQVKSAVTYLEKSRSRDGRDAKVMRDLGQAYAKLGQMGMASVVTAERYAMQNRFKDAAIHAKRASDLLPRGSGPWKRAQDVLLAAQAANKRR